VYEKVIQDQQRPAIVSGKLLYFEDEANLGGQGKTVLEVDAFSDYLASSKRGFIAEQGSR